MSVIWACIPKHALINLDNRMFAQCPTPFKLGHNYRKSIKFHFDSKQVWHVILNFISFFVLSVSLFILDLNITPYWLLKKTCTNLLGL